MKSEGNVNILKIGSLVILTIQHAVLCLSVRYARIRSGDMFISSTAVVMSEVVKLVISCILVYTEEKSIRKTLNSLNEAIIKQPTECLKICVPSFIFVIQNNLYYVAASHLDPATFQVTYQFKVFTTAIFTVIILRRYILPMQWGALIFLVIGIILVQLAQTKTTVVPSGVYQNRLMGFGAALSACVLSGFATIYFEKKLKDSDISLWVRNVQLSMLCLPFGLITSFISDGNEIYSKGFFFGYDNFVWYLVVSQAGGGLLIAVVMKYADNILKCFATSIALLISCVASVFLFDFYITLQFVCGACLVIFSIFCYNYKSPAPSVSPSTESTTTELLVS